jgi:hypothetical protein
VLEDSDPGSSHNPKSGQLQQGGSEKHHHPPGQAMLQLSQGVGHRREVLEFLPSGLVRVCAVSKDYSSGKASVGAH